MAQQDLPICPITLLEITDPVMDCNGHTFERKAIEQWYLNHDTSPITNQPVANKNLVPNYALKQMIDAKHAIQSQQTTQTGTTNISTIQVIQQNPVEITKKEKYIKPELNISQYIISSSDDVNHINIELNVAPLPENATRKPITCICVIDISGSMGERATEYKPNGENDGFSRLDLVKHSLNTIHQSLSGNDEMALITFNQYANIVLAPTTVDNKQLISTSINDLRPGGNTNLWAGLKNAIDMAKPIDTEKRNVSILVLTDGVSNYDPPRGFIPTFDTYIGNGNANNSGNGNSNGNTTLKYNIHTFAYGYDVDSEKLAYIATKGNGIFGFIPDGTMVGTIFINAMSNILATAINNLTLEISSNYHLKYYPANKMHSSANGINNTINIGSILYGQSINIVVQIDKPITYDNVITGIITNNFNNNEIIITNVDNPNDDATAYSMAINNTINIITALVENIKNKSRLNTFLEMITTLYPQTEFIKDLISDVKDADANKGQLSKAVEHTSWYNKWGRHYLRSVLRAYELQQCLNFKDLAPLHFAGNTFKTFQSQIEDIFSNITPPEPSLQTPALFNTSPGRFHISTSNGVGTSTTPSYASIPQSYYDVSGGCFTGGWLVNLADGTRKAVKDIIPGDIVISRNSKTGTAIVKCVIKLRINNDMQMVCLDGINGITPYHPIYIDTPECISDNNNSNSNNWVFPESYTGATYGAVCGDYMYDFILDTGHTVNMKGGFNIACLGHGITSSIVINHAYFGTNKVIDDLKDHEDWSKGYITLDIWHFIRNNDNLVVKLEY